MNQEPSLNSDPLPVDSRLPDTVAAIGLAAGKIRTETAKFLIGMEEPLSYLTAALMVKGHVLLEGMPGIAKTYLAKIFAQTLNAGFSRIQFTPDLMPGDIIGTNIFNLKTSEFSFKRGPVFSNIILIDEINRAPAKTQAALFEVMQEQQITLDGMTYKMADPFMVIATQNPVEQEGTYKLPEAQLDRFLYRIKMDYPSLDQEIRILNRFSQDFDQKIPESIGQVIDPDKIPFYRQTVEQITIREELLRYIATLVVTTRTDRNLYLGASTRASLGILKTAKALAALDQRTFVIPEDIQKAAYPVLNHRIILNPEREMEGTSPEEVIRDIISKLDVPR